METVAGASVTGQPTARRAQGPQGPGAETHRRFRRALKSDPPRRPLSPAPFPVAQDHGARETLAFSFTPRGPRGAMSWSEQPGPPALFRLGEARRSRPAGRQHRGWEREARVLRKAALKGGLGADSEADNKQPGTRLSESIPRDKRTQASKGTEPPPPTNQKCRSRVVRLRTLTISGEGAAEVTCPSWDPLSSCGGPGTL